MNHDERTAPRLLTHLQVLYFKRRCSACRTPRAERAAFCFQCGASLGRKAPFLIIASLLAAGLLFALPRQETKPMPVAESGQFNPHARLRLENRKKSPPPAGSPAAQLARIEELLAAEKGGGSHLVAAVELLDQLIDAHPDYAYGQRLKGNLLVQARRHDLAAAAFTAYLVIQPRDMNVRVSLARELMTLERWDEAAAELNKVAAAYPRYGLVPELLARIQTARGDLKGAALSRQRAQQLTQEPGAGKPGIVYLPRLPE